MPKYLQVAFKFSSEGFSTFPSSKLPKIVPRNPFEPISKFSFRKTFYLFPLKVLQPSWYCVLYLDTYDFQKLEWIEMTFYFSSLFVNQIEWITTVNKGGHYNSIINNLNRALPCTSKVVTEVQLQLKVTIFPGGCYTTKTPLPDELS